LSGNLTLSGSASSVWVFQAASTLITGSASNITVTGGASSCNVFWQVGSSATLGDNSLMVGTVMAKQSISALTSATVEGRLLASTGAVTLDSNPITVPSGCSTTFGTVTTSPTITSTAPPASTVDTPYSFTITASGTPTATFAVTSGSLPSGLTLNSATGLVSGTPTATGSFSFTITASNGASPTSSASYVIVVSSLEDLLPATGNEPAFAAVIGAALLILTGGTFMLLKRHKRSHSN